MTKDDLALLKAIATGCPSHHKVLAPAPDILALISRVEELERIAGKPAIDLDAENVMCRRVNEALREQVQGLFRERDRYAEERDHYRSRAHELEGAAHKREKWLEQGWNRAEDWAKLWKRLAKRRDAQLMWMAKKAAEYAGRTGAAEVERAELIARVEELEQQLRVANCRYHSDVDSAIAGELKAMKRVRELETENEELREYKHRYEDLCK